MTTVAGVTAVLCIAVASPALAATPNPKEQLIGLAILLIVFVVVTAVLVLKDQAALDPGDTTAATVDNLVEKLTGLEPGAYEITFIRQSGNVHRVQEVSSPEEAVRRVQATLRRAKIETVAILETSPTGFRIYRIWHNARGSSEGKKVGGATVRKI